MSRGPAHVLARLAALFGVLWSATAAAWASPCDTACPERMVTCCPSEASRSAETAPAGEPQHRFGEDRACCDLQLSPGCASGTAPSAAIAPNVAPHHAGAPAAVLLAVVPRPARVTVPTAIGPPRPAPPPTRTVVLLI